MTVNVESADRFASLPVSRESLRSGLPRALLLGALAAGIVGGVVYTLSPLSAWSAVAAVWLLAWVGRDLDERERRWVIAVLASALLVRLLVVVAMLLVSARDSQGALMLFGDEAYAQRRALRLRLIWAGMPGAPWDYINAFDEYGWSGFLYVLAYVQYLFGPAPFALRLVNTTLFVLGGALLFRLIRRAYGFLPAMGGLTILLFLPSLFVWSISLLKESLYFLMTAALLVVTVAIMRDGTLRGRLRLAVLNAALLVAIGLLRPGGVSLSLAGLLLGAVLWATTLRMRNAIVVAALLVAAIVVSVRVPAIENRLLAVVQSSARTHGGHVFTIGHSYKLLDPEFYVMPTFYTWTLTPAEAGRYVVRAFASFITVPTPWAVESPVELAYLPEQVVWYLLVLFAPIGIVAGFRRDALVSSMLLGYLAASAAGVALTSGNVGTLIRHRALSTPYLVWFSALGVVVFITWLASRAQSSEAFHAAN
jgi:hypothetical protein